VVNRRNGRFIRQMCMHCDTPTCASVCPVGAVVKTSAGPVLYNEDKCMGCRYCMQACPFGVPRYQWDSALPRVRKCTLCNDRVAAGLATACATVCPTGATKFGDRDELIEEATARIRANPDKYVNHIYGVDEVGGTSVLLISDVPFESLGYRTNLSKEPLPLAAVSATRAARCSRATDELVDGSHGLLHVSSRSILLASTLRSESDGLNLLIRLRVALTTMRCRNVLARSALLSYNDRFRFVLKARQEYLSTDLLCI
jgi:Fe-S-cluster-containing dehydrogenase component